MVRVTMITRRDRMPTIHRVTGFSAGDLRLSTIPHNWTRMVGTQASASGFALEDGAHVVSDPTWSSRPVSHYIDVQQDILFEMDNASFMAWTDARFTPGATRPELVDVCTGVGSLIECALSAVAAPKNIRVDGAWARPWLTVDLRQAIRSGDQTAMRLRYQASLRHRVIEADTLAELHALIEAAGVEDADRREAADKALALAAASGLPPLSGTEAQVRWAAQIRDAVRVAFPKDPRLRRNVTAKYWIDNKEQLLGGIGSLRAD